jgi:hypothetical protein
MVGVDVPCRDGVFLSERRTFQLPLVQQPCIPDSTAWAIIDDLTSAQCLCRQPDGKVQKHLYLMLRVSPRVWKKLLPT